MGARVSQEVSLFVVVFVFVAIGALLAKIYIFDLWKPAFWNALSQRTGLSYHPEWWLLNPHVDGVYRGYRTLIYNHRPYGKSPKIYARIVVALHKPATVSLYIADTEIKAHGVWIPPVEFITEDDAIDRKFVIDSKPSDFILSILQAPNVRRHLLNTHLLQVWTQGNELYIQQLGLDQDPERFLAVLNLAVDMAVVVDNHGVTESTGL